MKKILIIGASILQLPAIRKAKALGYYVGVADFNPQAVGIIEADEYFNVSTIDTKGIVQIAEEFQPDGIMTLATDMPMRAVAKACEVHHLPGISFDTAVKATDKGEMIKAFEEYDVAHPWFCIVRDKSEFDSILSKVSFPCIIKPTDSAGSRGVVLCYDLGDLANAYEYSQRESREGVVIIEEYLKGPEFSVEVMVVDGTPYVLQITDKLTTGAPHFVEMGHSQPTKQSEHNQKAIKDLACRAVKAVGIDMGPAHVEMILTEQGPKMVELGARMGGDCITTHLLPLSTGIDMVEATIKLSCGEPIDIKPKQRKGSAIRYFNAPKGRIKEINGLDSAKCLDGVREIAFMHNIGERLGEIESSNDRAGFVIAQASTANEAISICDKVISMIQIVVE